MKIRQPRRSCKWVFSLGIISLALLFFLSGVPAASAGPVQSEPLPPAAAPGSPAAALPPAVSMGSGATGTAAVSPADFSPAGSEKSAIVPRTAANEHLFDPGDTESDGVVILAPREEAAASNVSPYVWYNWSGSIAIPDRGAWVGVNCNEPTSIPSGYKVTMVKVHHEITHTYIGDLQVKVFNADHTWLIRENTGGSAQNISEDRYETTAFYNDDPKQAWSYRVRDTLGGDTGTLAAMKLYIYYKIPRPDLLPYLPGQWNDRIPIGVEQLTGSEPHSYTGPYREGQTLYFNWASANLGDLPAENYAVSFQITGPENFNFEWPGLTTGPGYYTYLTNDQAVGPLPAGTYTFKLTLDSTGVAEESNEGNNYYERTITVLPPPEKADLAPYCPSRWNDNIPIGPAPLAGADTHSYSGPYCTDQVLYFNWASANLGDDPAAGYTVRFEIAGPDNYNWEWPGLTTQGKHYVYLTNDQEVGPLAEGTYTFKLALDYTGVVDESTKANNYYERTITVVNRADLPPDLRVQPDVINLEVAADSAAPGFLPSLTMESGPTLRTISSENSGMVLELLSGRLDSSSGSEGTTRFEMAGFELYASPGDPLVPYREYFVAVPPDVDPAAVRISLRAVEETELEGEYTLTPAPPAAFREGNQTVLAWGEGKEIVDGKNILIYGGKAPYPAATTENLGGTRMRKWRIVSFAFFPLRWNPATGKVIVTTRAEAELSFPARRSLSSAETFELSDKVMEDRAGGLLANYPVAREWYRTPARKAGETSPELFDYLIVTTEAIRSGSAKLADFESHQESRGRNVITVTESGLYPDLGGALTASGWGGSVGDAAAENLRSWLVDNYSDLGVEFVLLIGNPHPAYGDLPMKMCWPRRHETENREAPTDYYYADLTGDWDQDGDGYFGEYIGDIGSAPVIPDVYLGRIPVYGTSLSALDSILQKTIDYASGAGAWRGKVLLPMEPSDDRTNGWPLGEGIKADFADSQGLSVCRIYDTVNTYSGGSTGAPASERTPCSLENVSAEWPRGYGLVTWWTHGNQTSAADIFNTSRVSLLDDSKPALTFQCSCTNGYPENSGNLGYKLLEKGAVGTVTASRVSWYYLGDGNWNLNGANSNLAYRYSGKILADLPAGRALSDLRNETARNTAERWMNHLVFNLYGDPSVHLNPAGDLQARFSIYNDGEGDLLVEGLELEAGASWLSVNPSPATPFTLAPGGSAAVGLTVAADGLASGDYSERVLIISNDPDGSPYPNGVYVNLSVIAPPPSPTPTVPVISTPTPDPAAPTPAPTAFLPPAPSPTVAPTPIPQQNLSLGPITIYADMIVGGDSWPKTASGDVNINGVIFADGEIEIQREGSFDGVYRLFGDTRLYLKDIPLPWEETPVEITLYQGEFSYEVDANGLILDYFNRGLKLLEVAGMEAEVKTITFLTDGVELSAILAFPGREATVELGRLRISRSEGMVVCGTMSVAGLDIEVDELEVAADRLTLNYGRIVFPDFFAPRGIFLEEIGEVSVSGDSTAGVYEFIARPAPDSEVSASVRSALKSRGRLESGNALRGTVAEGETDYPADFVALLYRLSGDQPSDRDRLIDLRVIDEGGRFEFSDLPSGDYAVTAAGRVTVEITNLEISPDGFYLAQGEISNIPDFEYAGMTLAVGGLTFGTDPLGVNLADVELVLPVTLGGGTVRLGMLQLTEEGVEVAGTIENFTFTIPGSSFGLTVDEIFFDTVHDRFGGTATLRAPTLPVITVGVGFTGREVSWVRAEVQDLNYPIYAVVFLQRIVLDINHLEPGPPAPIIVAAVGLSAGPTWPIPFTSNSIVLLAADPIALTIDTGDYAEISGDLTLFKPTSGALQGRISFLAWGWDYNFSGFDLAGARARISRTTGFTASAYLDILSILKGNTTLAVSRSNRVSGRTVGTLQVPSQVPMIGGKRLGGFSSVLNNSYLAGEGWVSRLLRVAVRFNYDGKIQFGRNLSSLGVNRLSARRLIALSEPGAELALAEEISVPAGMKRAVFRFAWEEAETEVTLIAPDKREITPEDGPLDSDFCNYIYDAVNREAWYVISDPQPGLWSYRLSDYQVGELTVELIDLEEPPAIEMAASPSASRGMLRLTSGQTFRLDWSTAGLTGGEKISLYYDEGNAGFTGMPLAEDIPADQGWYDWVVDDTVPSGNYFIYAVLDNGRSAPAASYMPGTVTVENPLAPTAPRNLALSVNGREVAVSWDENQETDLIGYLLEWTDDLSAFSYDGRLAVGLETSHTLDDLLNGRVYKVRVKAVNEAGYASLPSDSGSVKLGFDTKNTAPRITSKPVTRVWVGQTFRYQLEVFDVEGDELSYLLAVGPAAMVADPAAGLLEWTPGPLDVGLVEVVVEVSDATSVTRQKFFIEVYNSYMANLDPIITSLPPTAALAGREYLYQVEAFDPGDAKLAFVLAAAPAGMSISSTGMISWTPTGGDLPGEKLVEVRVSNRRGGLSRQVFMVFLQKLPPATPTPVPPLTPTPVPPLTPTPITVPTLPPTPEPIRTATPEPEPTASPTPSPIGPAGLFVDAGDYDGDGLSDIAVFRPASGLWAVRGVTRVYFGAAGDLPVSGDYTGNGTGEIAVFRPASGLWAARTATRVYFGAAGDLPVPGDWRGDGTAEIGIFRPATGLWAVRGLTRAYFGNSDDQPVPGYYAGDGRKSIGIFRPTNALWAVRDITRVYFGAAGDLPVPGDYAGDGNWEPAVFRSASGLWAARLVTRAYFGVSGDCPVPAGYAGGSDGIAVFRPAASLWAIRGLTRVYFGSSADLPATR